MTKTKTLVVGVALGCLVVLAPLTAAAQEMVAEPPMFDFYTVYIGDSATTTASLRNTNGGTIFITGWEWTYNPLNSYEVTSGLTLPAPVDSGTSVDYQVTFTPPDFSFWNGILRFHTSSPLTPTVDVTFWGFGDYAPPDPCAPLTDCAGVCVDTTSDITHCGGCGTVCGAPIGGSATCDLGVCGTDCGGMVDCGGVCQDLDNDVDNCGGCGNVCPDPVGGSAVCSAGVCGNDCGALTDCGGFCLDLDTDVDNCGACGNACPDPANGSGLCVTGMCDFDCDPGYVPDGTDCVPDAVDVRDMLVDLLDFFDDSIADGSIEGTGSRWWARAIQVFIMRRQLEQAIREYDRGRMDRVCFRLDRAYLRSDGMRSPRDFVQGPAVDDLADDILAVMAAAGCS